MGKSSQRKGRAAEIEVANILKAVGFDACVCGIYETLDVRCAIDGTDRLLEVKRKKETQGEAYKAIENGAWGLASRADRKEWLLTVPLKTFLTLAGDRGGNEAGATFEVVNRSPSSQDGATPSAPTIPLQHKGAGQ